MSDKYKTFDNKNIEYSYDKSWKKRNKDYLKMMHDRSKDSSNIFKVSINETHDLNIETKNETNDETDNCIDDAKFILFNCGNSIEDE